MINSVAKADALVRGLKEKLGFHLGESLLVESRDAAGWPVLIYNSAIALRIKGIDAVSKDIFGNSFAAFAPHVLDIAYEAAVLAVPAKEYSIVLHECSKIGVKIQVRDVADATVLANLDAAADFALEFDLRFPTKGA